VTEVRQPDATAGSDPTAPVDPGEVSGAQTVEEVEAYWRNRTSGIQRAHNAETATMQAQMEALRKPPASTPPEGESADAARARALEAELQTERQARQAIELRSAYPRTSEVLGDAILKLAETPEKLAAIEASYENGQGNEGGPPVITPNAARRSVPGMPGAATEKPLNEKSKDELLADLKRATPAFVQAQKEGLIP
jgi:hypothetical protein